MSDTPITDAAKVYGVYVEEEGEVRLIDAEVARGLERRLMDAMDPFGKGPDVLVSRDLMRELGKRQYLPCSILVRGDHHSCNVCKQSWITGSGHLCPYGETSKQ